MSACVVQKEPHAELIKKLLNEKHREQILGNTSYPFLVVSASS